jgi:hypothetical protein
MKGQPSISDMIGFSWKKSLELLLPFHFKRWFKILIIVWLAGAGIQGCNLNFRIPKVPQKTDMGKPAKVYVPAVRPARPPIEKMERPSGLLQSAPQGKLPGQEAVQPPALSTSADSQRIAKSREMAPTQGKKSKLGRGWGGVIIAGVSLFGVVFILGFLWLGARFNFVLLNALVNRDAKIREAFKLHKEQGNSFFKWSLALFGIAGGLLLVLGIAAVPVVLLMKANKIMGLAIGLALILLAAVMVLATAMFGITVRDFVLPVMYKENVKTLAGIGRFMKAKDFRWVEVLKYLLVILGLGTGAIIVQGIVAVIVALAGIIAGGMFAIPGIFLLKAMPFLKIPVLVAGGLLAAVLVLAVIVTVGMVMLPAVIFFRAFALTFLTRLYPDCDLLRFQESR